MRKKKNRVPLRTEDGTYILRPGTWNEAHAWIDQQPDGRWRVTIMAGNELVVHFDTKTEALAHLKGW